MIERWLVAIRDHPGRPPAHQCHVLTMLALRMDWVSGHGFAGVRDLMADADASKNTVMRATSWARSEHLLLRTRRGHYINAQTTIASEWQLTQGASTETLGQSQSPNGSNPKSQPGQPKVSVETTHQESSSSESSSSLSEADALRAMLEAQAPGADEREIEWALGKILGDAGIRHPAAYLRAALANGDGWALISDARSEIKRMDAGSLEPQHARRAAPWCGSCDERTRLQEDDQGRPYRCPNCHPLTQDMP